MSILTNLFYNLLVFFSWLIPGHYVWIAIVLITVLIRFIFLRSSIKMVEVQHKQKKLQPHLAKIKETHKGDKQAEQKATMALYREHGVNPLSGCLPMIVQLVVLLAFYRIFTKLGVGSIQTQDLYSFVPRPDSLNTSFFGLDLTKTVAVLFKSGGWSRLALLLPIIAGATQLIQSLQTRALQPKPQEGEQQAFQKALNSQFTYLFPIMTAYISYTLTSALSIYWITQTVFMIIQQAVVMKRFAQAEKAEATQLSAGAVSPSAEKTPTKTIKKGDVVVEIRQKGSKE